MRIFFFGLWLVHCSPPPGTASPSAAAALSPPKVVRKKRSTKTDNIAEGNSRAKKLTLLPEVGIPEGVLATATGEKKDGSIIRGSTKMMRLVQIERELINRSHIHGPLLGNDESDIIRIDGTDRDTLVHLGAMVAFQRTATIFQVEEYPDVFLKYEVNCDCVRSKIHPLMRETVIMKQIEGKEIGPRVFYLSAPLKYQYPSKRNQKLSFSLDEESLSRCAEIETSSVRVMAMQRLGTSLARSLYEDSEHMNGWPLKEALQMGIDLLEVVRKLHALDIVHGDIHPGNVVLLPAEKGLSAIRLIDFGKSFFSSDATGKKAEIREPMTYIHSRFSPFSLLGYRFGFRDDLFNALHILAVLLVGSEFEPYLESLVRVNGGSDLLEFKSSQYYFAIPHGRDPVEENTFMDPSKKQLIKERLSQAMALARGQHDGDAPAPVEEVIHLIEAALSIAIDN